MSIDDREDGVSIELRFHYVVYFLHLSYNISCTEINLISL